jgi:hypothetical protein
MRKLLITALLASVAATPAVAAPRDRDAARAERQQDREDRQNAREERAKPEQVKPERAEPQVELRVRNNDGPARVEAAGRADRQSVETIRVARDQRIEDRAERIEDRQQVRDQRLETNRINRQLRQSERVVPNVLRPRVPVVSNTPRIGTQPPPRTESRRHAPVNWSSHWRNDRRYDWYNWRNRNRWLFNLGFYSDPFGWGYQRYNIGWRMWPNYYQSNFWLNDPWEYRLPYAPPGTRWVRYYNDAILVDTWDGRVVDVIYNFFW